MGLVSTTSTGEAESTSTGPEPCGDHVHEGNLEIDAWTDLPPLRQIRIVSGSVYVGHRQEERDLSFLECIEEIHGELAVYDNVELQTTAGLDNLRRLDGPLQTGGNRKLKAIEGLGTVSELPKIEFEGFLEPIERLDLPHLERLDILWIGACAGAPRPMLGYRSELTDLDGFPSLQHLRQLVIHHQSKLTSIAGLEAIRRNGGGPIEEVEIKGNEALPEAHIHEVLDMVGTESRDVCANKDGDWETCLCRPGA